MTVSRSLILVLTLLTFAASIVSPSHLVVAASGATLIFGIWLLWPKGGLPVLLLPFALQWLEVAVKPIETAVLVRPLDDLADFYSSLTPAALLGLASVAALGVGMRMASRSKEVGGRLADETCRWPQKAVVQFSLAAIVAGHLFDFLSDYAGPARQIVGALGYLQDAGLFILAYRCMLTRSNLALLALVVSLEIVVGMLGFFANFRGALLVLLLAAAAARPKLSPSGVAGVLIALSILLTVAVFWQSIKRDYRGFLNERTREQVVLRPVDERLGYVAGQAGAFSAEGFGSGLQALADRTSYIDFLGKTLEHVPLAVPFQGGAQTTAAIEHVITPRILFPDKPDTPSDTFVTEKYTGLHLDRSGYTSISIGYVGELYVDFDYVGSIVGAFILGLMGGYSYKLVLLYRRTPLLLNCGLAVMVALQYAVFETALIKFLGSALMMAIVCAVFQRNVLTGLMKITLPRWTPYASAKQVRSG
jgi:hypothetical protein